MKKMFMSVIVALLAATSWSQQAPTAAANGNNAQELAKIVEIEGLVTVTTGNQLVNAANDMRLRRGARIATTTGATTTLEFRNGCRIRIKANETYTVDDEDCCGALFAIVPLAPLAAAAGVAVSTPLLLTGGVVGVIGVISTRNDRNLSGS